MVKKEKDIKSKFQRDKKDLKNILEITNKVLEQQRNEKAVEKFYRIGRSDAGEDKPIKFTFQSFNMMEDLVRNAKNLHEEEELKKKYM